MRGIRDEEIEKTCATCANRSVAVDEYLEPDECYCMELDVVVSVNDEACTEYVPYREEDYERSER